MTLKRYLAKTGLANLAIPSNIAYGTAIYERGAVEVIAQEASMIEAWAGGLSGAVGEGGGGKRHVWMEISSDQHSWHCSGNPKTHDIFCKHCVAVALFLVNN